MKKLLILILTCILTFSCADLKKSYVTEPSMVSVPFNLNIEFTKVSYDEGYNIKTGDKLHIVGTDRSDVHGILNQNTSGEWVGDLWYDENEGELNNTTNLTVSLIHADNSDESTYSHGCRTTLQKAIEELSLFEGNTVFSPSSTVILRQQTCFINTIINIDFTGPGYMTTGETSLDVVINDEIIATGLVNIINVKELSYESSFTIALPGGTILSDGDSFIQICDRNIPMRSQGSISIMLDANKYYNINRSIVFKPELGDPYWSDGSFGRISHPSDVEIVGIIVYTNNDKSETSNCITEKNYGGGNALVMSLYNAAVRVNWGTGSYTSRIKTPSETIITSNMSGYSNSLLESGCNAADLALNYRNGLNDNHNNDTGWFLPSVGQWICSLSDFAQVDPKEEWFNRSNKKWLEQGSIDSDLVFVKEGPETENLLVKYLNRRFETLKNHFGCEYDPFGIQVYDETKGKYVNSDSYWTSSEYSNSEAIRFNLGSVERKSNKYYSTFKVAHIDKGSVYAWKSECPLKIRPFLAF